MRGKQGRRRAQSSAQTRSGPSARGGFADLIEFEALFDLGGGGIPVVEKWPPVHRVRVLMQRGSGGLGSGSHTRRCSRLASR